MREPQAGGQRLGSLCLQLLRLPSWLILLRLLQPGCARQRCRVPHQ